MTDIRPGSFGAPVFFVLATLQHGMTYRFNIIVNGHPFRISTSNGGPSFNVGVTNNDVMLGTLTFKVPMDAPNTLYYYCLAHPGMNGVINISY